VVTVLQRLMLSRHGDAPVDRQRQRSAFPPNYIHCIDSSHMMLTALACQRAGAPPPRPAPRCALAACSCVWPSGRDAASRGRAHVRAAAAACVMAPRTQYRQGPGSALTWPQQGMLSCSECLTLSGAARAGVCGRARLVLDARGHGGRDEPAAARGVRGAALAAAAAGARRRAAGARQAPCEPQRHGCQPRSCPACELQCPPHASCSARPGPHRRTGRVSAGRCWRAGVPALACAARAAGRPRACERGG